MKLNCAEFYSNEPTEEMIADLVRNNAKRGEFMKPQRTQGSAKMKTLITIALTASALAVQAKTSTPAGWTDDYDAALKRAATEKKLVLADFSGSDWCGWCKKLDQEIFDTEEFRHGATNEYVLLMVDSPQDQGLLSEKAKKQNPKLVKKYKVRGFPTVLVLDAKGEVVFQGGYEKGGPKKYLKKLARGVKEAPDIAK